MEEVNKGGRPEIPIDWKKVNSLIEAGCSGIQIAGYFDIDKSTLYDRCVKEFGISYTDYSTKKREKGNSLLHVKQYETAMNGNVSMQIWLGKQRLDQREKKDIFLEDKRKVTADIFPDESELKNGENNKQES